MYQFTTALAEQHRADLMAAARQARQHRRAKTTRSIPARLRARRVLRAPAAPVPVPVPARLSEAM